MSELFDTEGEARALLLGAGREFDPSAGVKYSDLRSEATFRKYHVDNFYLELLVEGGLVGGLLFLIPYGMVARRFWRLRAKRDMRLIANMVLAFLVGVAVQGNFAPTIPIFNSPLGFMFAVFVGSVTLMDHVVAAGSRSSLRATSLMARRGVAKRAGPGS